MKMEQSERQIPLHISIFLQKMSSPQIIALGNSFVLQTIINDGRAMVPTIIENVFNDMFDEGTSHKLIKNSRIPSLKCKHRKCDKRCQPLIEQCSTVPTMISFLFPNEQVKSDLLIEVTFVIVFS